MKIILPDNVTPPRKTQCPLWTLDVLGPAYNTLDFEAWTGSRRNLKNALGQQKTPG